MDHDKIAMYRARKIPSRFVADPTLPHIVVISHAYGLSDNTGLPSASQYEAIGQFEAETLDKIEASELGVIAFIRTCDGIVRYFVYVSDVDQVTSMLFETTNTRFEVAAGDDPEWKEYKAFCRCAGLAN
jgi:hypothetical protein